MVKKDIFYELVEKCIEITEDVPNINTGGLGEPEDMGGYMDTPWFKLGIGTLLQGERYYVEGFMNEKCVRLLLLPEKRITADLRLDELTTHDFFKAL